MTEDLVFETEAFRWPARLLSVPYGCRNTRREGVVLEGRVGDVYQNPKHLEEPS